MPKTKANRKCNASKLKRGTFYSRVSYGKFTDAPGQRILGRISIENEDGNTWQLDSSIVEDEFFTPDQYDKVEEVTRTEMAQIIMSNARIVMTVNFKKKPEHKTLVDTVTTLLEDARGGAKKLGPRQLSSKLREATEGEERTMIGRHYGQVDEFGRLQFIDMENLKSNGGLRQVDPRTVEWAIVANVKYVLK